MAVKYNGTFLTPLKVIISSFIFLIIFCLVLNTLEFYENSDYFRWGVPVSIFKKEVTSNVHFYILLLFFFFNKIINTLVTEIVYTFIVNCIQDPKSNDTFYSKNTSLLIVLMNACHFSMNSMFTVNGNNSQISFLIVDMLGNLIIIYYTNKKFIDRIHHEHELSLLLGDN